MDEFQKKVVGVAVVVLVFVLGSTYYLLNYSAKKENWPPYISICPDYWYYNDASGVCVNVKNLGTDGTPASFDPNDSTLQYNNQPITTACGQYNFATQYNLPWQGISYAYQVLPCSGPPST
jgi:hypothetical protein